MKNLVFCLLALFLFLLANPHLTHGSEKAHLLAFHLPSLLEGQWWRLLTSSFLHASWGHLFFGFLTTLGFLLLLPVRERIIVFFVGGLGVILVPLLLTPASREQYILGVSGITHGLVVACIWPTLSSPRLFERLLSRSSLVFVYLKVGYESITGILVDFGLVSGFIDGFCKDGHLGGVLAITLYCILRTFFKKPPRRPLPGSRPAAIQTTS